MRTLFGWSLRMIPGVAKDFNGLLSNEEQCSTLSPISMALSSIKINYAL